LLPFLKVSGTTYVELPAKSVSCFVSDHRKQ
jgi:hypothetical protein